MANTPALKIFPAIPADQLESIRNVAGWNDAWPWQLSDDRAALEYQHAIPDASALDEHGDQLQAIVDALYENDIEVSGSVVLVDRRETSPRRGLHVHFTMDGAAVYWNMTKPVTMQATGDVDLAELAITDTSLVTRIVESVAIRQGHDDTGYEWLKHWLTAIERACQAARQ